MANIQNVVAKTLNNETLNNDIFKQIGESSDLEFISIITKNSINDYIKSNDMSFSRRLWKNLLIDSIAILKMNDKREKIYSDSKSDKPNFRKNFNSSRIPNSYGIDEIDKYFDDFIEFESVLYGTDKHYRDHVEHVLKVWAIGISLLTFHNVSLHDGFTARMETDFHFDVQAEISESGLSKSEIWAIWTVIALCHDLGYPIEKTSKINQQAKKIISHFGNMNFSELNYCFDIFNTFLVKNFLNIISSKANLKDCKTSVQTKYRDKFSKSLEDYKHGIFSSLLLFKHLTYFLETDIFNINNKLSPEDIRQFYIRKEILRAISGHTCNKIYHIDLNTFSFLLILCDELQEWNRPGFDALKENLTHFEPKVELKKYNMSEEQEIEMKHEYDFDPVDSELTFLVFNRFKSIHCLLRNGKGDNNRVVKFNWMIIFATFSYSLSFDSTKDSFNVFLVEKIEGVKRSPINIYDPS